MKRLIRMKEGKLTGGVLGNIGSYSEIDPVAIRILFVVLTMLPVGIGVIMYIAVWTLMHEKGSRRSGEPRHAVSVNARDRTCNRRLGNGRSLSGIS